MSFLNRLWTRWLLRKPLAATAVYWDRWFYVNRHRRPVRFFLQETLPDRFRHLLMPLRDAVWWVRYRTINRQHVYRVRSLRPGYCGFESFILHINFSLLADYVEIICASRNYTWHRQRRPRWQPW